MKIRDKDYKIVFRVDKEKQNLGYGRGMWLAISQVLFY